MTCARADQIGPDVTSLASAPPCDLHAGAPHLAAPAPRPRSSAPCPAAPDDRVQHTVAGFAGLHSRARQRSPHPAKKRAPGGRRAQRQPHTSAGRPRRVAEHLPPLPGSLEGREHPSRHHERRRGPHVLIRLADALGREQILRLQHSPPLVKRQLRYAADGRLHGRRRPAAHLTKQEADSWSTAPPSCGLRPRARRASTSASARGPPASGPRPTTSTACR